MKKTFNIAVWVLVLLLTVGLSALAALYLLADPNKLKPVITSEVKKRTGYDFVIDGGLSWSIYPQIGVKAQHVLVTAPGQTKPFLEMRRVNIAVVLSQLIHGYSRVKGEVHIGEVTLLGVHLTSALVGVHWQDNILTLRPIQAALYGGSLNGFALGKNFSSIPAWNWDFSMNHVDMQPLLLDANGASSQFKLLGTGRVNIVASTQGLSRQQMLQSLNGTTNFAITNGTVQGIDVDYLIKTVQALLSKDMQPPVNANLTQFTNFTGSLIISNGLAETNNLLLTSDTFNVKGQGKYQLPNQTIDLALQLQAPEVNKNWDIPFAIRGELSKPNVVLDMREVNKQIASKEIDKAKEKVRDTIKEKIPGPAGDYLQSLLGS